MYVIDTRHYLNDKVGFHGFILRSCSSRAWLRPAVVAACTDLRGGGAISAPNRTAAAPSPPRETPTRS
jgi:hypothetical protein